MECWLCIRSQQDGFYTAVTCKGVEHVNECPRPTDKIPKLSEDNRRFWILFQKILPGLNTGFGGFDYQAIESVFNILQVNCGQRPILLDRCLIVISVIQTIREKQDGSKS